MRTFLAAAIAASALVIIPVGAYAQNGTQTTETQQNFKDSVKAKPRTMKRQGIIRSESDKHSTTGAAPNGR
jgi:hypothetical protein